MIKGTIAAEEKRTTREGKQNIVQLRQRQEIQVTEVLDSSKPTTLNGQSTFVVPSV